MDQGAPGDARLPLATGVLGATVDASDGDSYLSLARWLPLIRPATLPLAVGPSLAALGLVWASGAHVALLPALSVLLSAILVLAGANMLDVCLDSERLVLLLRATVLRATGRGSRLDATDVRPLDALRVSGGLIGAGVLCGVPAALAGGPATVLLGLVGVAAALLYSSTDYALKRLPGGELVVALALGPGLVLAAVLGQRQRLTAAEMFLGLAFGCFVLALLALAHLRDAADRQQRRTSLVTLLGNGGGRALCVVSLAGAYLFAVLLALQPRFAHGALAALLSLPTALIPLTGVLLAQGQAALRLLIGQTLRAYTVFSCWLIAGFLFVGVAARLYPPIHTFLFG